MSGMMNVRHLSKKMLLPVVVLLVVAMGIGLFFMYPNLFSNDPESFALYKGPSAKVNGKKISDKDFNDVYMQLLQSGYFQMSTSEEIKDQALEYATNEKIIAEFIKKNKIRTNDQELKRFLDKMVYDRYKTPEELEGVYQRFNVKNKQELKDMFRDYLNYQNMYAYLAKKWGVKATEDELKEAFQEVELAHILIATNPKVKQEPLSDEEAKKRAEEAYQKVKSGTEFATVAREYSDDPSKDNGGNLGTETMANFKRGFDKDFMAAVTELKVGEVSAPVKTQFGYHIIKLISQTEAKGKEFDTVKKDLERDILAAKLSMEKKKEYDKWFKDLVKKADVEIIDPALRAFRLKKENKLDEAILAYDKALKDKRYKEDLDVYLSAAVVNREKGNHDKALSILKRYKKDPSDVRIQMAMANVYDAMGNKKTAKNTLVKAAKDAGEDLYKKRAVSALMEELKYEQEAKTLNEEIAAIQKRIEQQQKQEQLEFEEMLNNQNNQESTDEAVIGEEQPADQ